MKHNILREAFSWQPNGNIGVTLGSMFRKVIGLREGGPTQGWIQSGFHFGRYVSALQRSQGWRGVVVHLKGCHVLLQQAVGGQILDNPRRLGCAISRSRQGLPRVIPVIHRQRILRGDVWAIKIWSSFFWLYRVIEIPGKLKLGTITRPFTVNYLIVMAWCEWLVLFLPVFWELVGRPDEGHKVLSLRRSLNRDGEETSLLFSLVERPAEFIEYLTALLLPHRESDLSKKIPRKEWKSLMRASLTELQPRSLLLLNSGPNSSKSPDEGPGPTTRTSIGSILTDCWLWLQPENLNLRSSMKMLWASANAFSTTVLAQANLVFNQLDSFGVRHLFGTYYVQDSDGVWRSDPLPGFSNAQGLGKLSFIPEPAGKIRVVAMVDTLTQMLLRPLHDAVFGLLRKIPQDGTFDQTGPAKLLAAKGGIRTYYSYDLSAATDRFPVSLQQALLGYLIGPRVARHWTQLLTGRTFNVPKWITDKQRVPQGTPRSVQYNAGQPMGAYTSWAVFALSHHFLVQFAAYQAFGILKWFELYALLGDDVVIGNDEVAEKYLLLLRAIGVEVGLAKSLISRRGVFEFAKRTFRVTDDGLLLDISGVSLAAIAAAVTDSSVMESLLTHANVRSAREGLRIACRVLGKGFRARSSLGGELMSMNSRLMGLAILLTRPSGLWGLTPVEWLSQVTVEVRGVLSDEDDMIFKDAVYQRLIASARRLAESRVEVLRRWGNPVDEKGEFLSRIRSLPRSYRSLWGYPLYEEFLREMVFQPMLNLAVADLATLLDDLKTWCDGGSTEGNFSLDEIYTTLTRLIDSFQTIDTEINLFIRRNTEKSSGRKMSRRRSAMLKLWKGVRRVLAGRLTR
nr:RNA-dependent RNA polymerase [Rhizophagus clarus mitovirus 5]